MSYRLAKITALGFALALSLVSVAPSQAQTLKIVRMTLTTNPSTTTIRNIDVAGGLAFTKVKRYTVSLSPLVGFPANVSRVEVRNGVLNETATSATQATVLSRDASAMTLGATVGPFAGTNAFVRIQRGADGLGARDVQVNVYIEVEP
jgi:hypothetical protein